MIRSGKAVEKEGGNCRSEMKSQEEERKAREKMYFPGVCAIVKKPDRVKLDPYRKQTGSRHVLDTREESQIQERKPP